MEQIKRRMEKLVRELKEEGCLLEEDYDYFKIGTTEYYEYEIYLNGFHNRRFGIKLSFQSPDEDIKIKKEVENINLKDYVLYENGENTTRNHFAHCVHLRDVKIKYLDVEKSGYNLIHKSQLYKIFAIYKKLFIFMYDCYMHFRRFKDDTLIVETSIYKSNLFNIYKVIRFLDRNDVKYRILMRNMVEPFLNSSNKYGRYSFDVNKLRGVSSKSEEFDIIINKIEEDIEMLKRL